VCHFEFTGELKTWISTNTPSVSVRSWSHIFYGTSAHIGVFELTRTSVSGHHGRTVDPLDVKATLSGSSDENLVPTTGMCVCPLTVLGYISLGKATPLYFHKSFTFRLNSVSQFGISIVLLYLVTASKFPRTLFFSWYLFS
jgi:hypothetical protein